MRMDTQPLGNVIQAERIRQRQPIAPGKRRLVGVEDLVEDPRSHQDPEDPRVVAQAGQHREDDNVRDRLGVLPVVHRADAGNEA